ncbi:MAG: caspase family protein [Myxococcales bacterium]
MHEGPDAVRPWLLAALWLLVPAAASAGERIALLVASDVGLPGEASLRYTADDAQRMASVLVDVGGFEAADVQVLRAANAEQVLAALAALAQRAQKAETFLFYFSGHADAASLHPAGTLLPVDELLSKLAAVPAQLRVAIIDACQSGAATRAKGTSAGPAFDVRLDQRDAEGQIVITSSAADEQSFESESQRGALFTMSWTAGLRGAADHDGDGRVTLTEAYTYAYSQTLRSTLLSSGGPQHPTFRWDFSGHQDPVLSQLGAGAQLTFVAEEDGSYVVFDQGERSVVAELPVRGGERRRLALAPGPYVVNKRGKKDVRWASVELSARDDRLLYDHQMRPVPLVRLARKGALANAFAVAGAGQLATPLGAGGFFAAHLGAEWEQERWLLGAQVLISTGSETSGTVQGDYSARLTARSLFVGPELSALYGLRWGPATFRGGPLAAVVVVSESVQAQPDRVGMALVAGARLRAELRAEPARLAARPGRRGGGLRQGPGRGQPVCLGRGQRLEGGAVGQLGPRRSLGVLVGEMRSTTCWGFRRAQESGPSRRRRARSPWPRDATRWCSSLAPTSSSRCSPRCR